MISNKFWCETSMMYPGTNFVYIAKKIEAYSRILSCYFHLFQNGLIASELQGAGILFEK